MRDGVREFDDLAEPTFKLFAVLEAEGRLRCSLLLG